MKNALRATWSHGRILLSEPVDWHPEGCELLVAQVESLGLDESRRRDDPEGVAAWIAAVEKMEPIIWAEGEREEYERFRQQSRHINIDAVRKQMETKPGGEVA